MAEAAAPADLAAEAVEGTHPLVVAVHPVVEAIAVGVEATATVDITRSKSLISKSRPIPGGFSIGREKAS
jgi:hypothetical protein